MIGQLDMETIPQHGAIKTKNMFKQNHQLKIKFNQRFKLNLQQLLNLRRNKIRKTWMIGLLVMETILQLGAIKTKNMYKFLQKLPPIKKINQLLKQKLKQNHQQQDNQRRNKIKKTWMIGHQDTETILQHLTRMINS